MYNVGIVGHGKNKFDERTTAIARGMIYDIIMDALNNHPKVNVRHSTCDCSIQISR
jgi:hypothetical protein